MFKNYFKTAIRNLLVNKTISFINITGLTLGMTGAALLILNLQYEFSVDQFHANKENIYKVYNKGMVNGRLACWDVTAIPLGPALEKDYPEIKNVARVAASEKLLSYADKKIKAAGSYTDPSFLKMFSFPLVKGSMQTSFLDGYSIIITHQLANKIFGDEDPLNKIIRINNTENYIVKGVLRDLPFNTAFKFEYLLPLSSAQEFDPLNTSWDNAFVNTYVELHPGTHHAVLNNKIAGIINKHGNYDQDRSIFLYPFTRGHMWGRFENGKPAGGRIENVRMLVILAVIMLLIACINFMNLSTARSEKRAREVGIRKVMGAGKRSLIKQFIGESVLLALIAGITSLVLVQLILPLFGLFANVHLEVAWQSPWFWLGTIGFILFTGILAGSYPAFYLSSFQPVKVLKGVLKNGNALITPRKVLVILQFVFSVFLINFTILFRKQFNYSQNRETGFVKANLIFLPLTDDLVNNYALFKNELVNAEAATSVSRTSTPVTRGGTAISGLKWEGMNTNSNISFEFLTSSENFVETNGISLVRGRDIDVTRFPADTASCLINETAQKMMGLEDPVGQLISEDSTIWKIVGVIKDFIISSPSQVVSPALIVGSKQAGFISIRLRNSGHSTQNLQKVKAVLMKYNPNFLSEYQFADDDYSAKFRQQENAAVLINSFTLVAVFISCMGLFGLAAYTAENKTKEIGIRKILGASVTRITALLVKEFVKPVMIAIIIASPLAWLFMNFFLSQFSYRTGISWWILVIAGSGALFIALFTVSFQSVKAAITNPVKNLRAE